VQIFEGLVIAVKHGKGLDATFTVRKIAAGGVGVERTYPLHSPNIVKVERTKTAKVSRGKLYYMRDRMGKNARFKNEALTPMKWDESANVVEAAPVVDMSGEDTVEEITEAVVETADAQEKEIMIEEAVAELEAPQPVEEPAKTE